MALQPFRQESMQIDGVLCYRSLYPEYETNSPNGLNGHFDAPSHFSSQCIEVHINRARVVQKPVPPNMVQQLLSRANPIRVRSQVFQQTILQTGQMNIFTVFAHMPLFAVQFNMFCNEAVHKSAAKVLLFSDIRKYARIFSQYIGIAQVLEKQ